MRNKIFIVALLAAALWLTGCVSSKLAEANERSVGALADAAVQQDEANIPLAQDSVATAEAVTDATGTLAQITNLGVPAELTDKNFENVQALSAAVTGTEEPRVAALANSAQRTAGELAGKGRSQQTFVTAVRRTPVGAWITDILAILGGAGAAAYGTTRGRKHLWRWWNTPSTDAPPPAPPGSDSAA